MAKAKVRRVQPYIYNVTVRRHEPKPEAGSRSRWEKMLKYKECEGEEWHCGMHCVVMRAGGACQSYFLADRAIKCDHIPEHGG